MKKEENRDIQIDEADENSVGEQTSLEILSLFDALDAEGGEVGEPDSPEKKSRLNDGEAEFAGEDGERGTFVAPEESPAEAEGISREQTKDIAAVAAENKDEAAQAAEDKAAENEAFPAVEASKEAEEDSASDTEEAIKAENEPLYFPITDDELTAKNINTEELKKIAPRREGEIIAPGAHSDVVSDIFPITDDEFTARSLEDESRQTSISDIDESIPEIDDIKEPAAVEIPSAEDDDPEIVITRERKPEEKSRPIDNRFDFLELFVFTVVAVLIITTFLFRHSIVDGGSMERTLFDGEHLIISDFFYTPKRGDIIVFQDNSKAEYSTSLAKPLVKRVIAIGGDTVRIYRDGRVFVNDMNTPLDESDYVYTTGYSYAFGSYADLDIPYFTYYPSAEAPEYIECTLPEGELFVMGDHRDGSTDSRDFGTISESTVLGRVLVRFYPFERFGRVE